MLRQGLAGLFNLASSACRCVSVPFSWFPAFGKTGARYIATDPGVVSASRGGYTTCLASSSAAAVTGARWPVIAPAQMRCLVSFQKEGVSPNWQSRGFMQHHKSSAGRKTTARIYQMNTLIALPRAITHASCRFTDQHRLIQDLTHRPMCSPVMYDFVFR